MEKCQSSAGLVYLSFSYFPRVAVEEWFSDTLSERVRGNCVLGEGGGGGGGMHATGVYSFSKCIGPISYVSYLHHVSLHISGMVKL